MSGSGPYHTIRDAIQAVWTANWTETSVPVFWRENDAEPLPDPSTTPYFLRNEIDFAHERVRAFGGGRNANERLKFGSLIVRVFAARSLQNDDLGLDLMDSAEAMYRSLKIGDLSFIGEMSGFDDTGEPIPMPESGNWFMRGSLIVFEYRFVG